MLMETWRVSLDWEHQNARDLKEQIGENGAGSKVIIWELQATKGMRIEVTYDCCLFLSL